MLISSLAVQSLCFGMNTKAKQSKNFPVLRGQDVLVRMDSSTVDSYMQSGRDMLPSPLKAVLLSAVMVHCWFLVSKSHPCSGPSEPGTRPSLQEFLSGERMEVSPFDSGPVLASIWPLFFSIVNHNAPLGMDAVAH